MLVVGSLIFLQHLSPEKKQEANILLPYADLSTRSILQIRSLKPENASFYMCRKNATEKFG